MKHTPGPWNFNSIGFLLLDDGTAIQIKHHIVDNRMANTRLIAAAPELLEALIWIERELFKPDPDKTQIAVIMKNAIAKAEGK